jgi:hypothetical protein
MLQFSDLHMLFKCAFFCYGENGRMGLPLFFVSPPGESKTSLARQFAARVSAWFGALEGSRLDAVDVAGLPQFSPDGQSFRFVPPAVLRAAADTPTGLLFLDELTRAPASVQAGFLTLLLEGRTEGVQLPESTRIWAAANPAAQVGGVELDPANASRLVWIDWPAMSADNWRDYVMTADTRTGAPPADPIDYDREMLALEAGWDAAMMRARAAVVGFLSVQGSRLRENAPDEARAWANPRTWSMAARALASATLQGASHNVQHALVAGCVGAGNATAFLTWVRAQDLPSARDVLAGRAQLPIDKKRPDRTLAVMAECIATADATHAERVWTLVDECKAVSGEVAVLAVRSIAARRKQCPELVNPKIKAFAAFLQDPTFRQIASLLAPQGT